MSRFTEVKFKDFGAAIVAKIPKDATSLWMNTASKELKFEITEEIPKPEIKTPEKKKPKKIKVSDLVLSDVHEKLLSKFIFVSDLPEDLTEIKGVGEITASLIKEAIAKFNKG